MAPKTAIPKKNKSTNSETYKKLENKYKETDQKIVMMMHLLQKYKEIKIKIG